MASACGALSAIARNPSCGLGNRRIFARFLTRKSIAWPPRSTSPDSALQNHPHHRLGPGKPTAYPRAIIENQLQAVLADSFADLVSAELRRAGLNFSVDFSFTSGVKRKFSG